MTERQGAPVEDGNGNGQEREPSSTPQIWWKAKEWVDELDIYSCHHFYHLSNGDGTYLERTRTELKVEFIECGIDPKWHNDLLWVIDHQRAVHYAGPLSGRRAGLHIFKTRKLLCTEGPRIIEGRKGKCQTIVAILKALFGKEQLRYVIGWLSTARASMINGSFKPGQVLIMAGPVNTGKSFTQKYIFTPILGGRDTRPFLFMSGQTSFNAEHFAAEHHIFDDEAAEDDPRMRNKIAATIRQFASSDDAHCHDKGLKGLTLPFFARLSISCNDDEKGLLALPPLNMGLATKVILLKAQVGDFRWPQNDAERMALKELVETEYPAFAYELDRFEIPAELRDQRYGIKAYQDAEMARKLARVGQDYELLALMREAIITSKTEGSSFEGTAGDCFQLIFKAEHLREGLRRIVTSPRGLGKIFTHLFDQRTPGLIKKTVHGESVYEVDQDPEQGGD